jgi:transcriptional regulator with XRE-family HTH domain
MSEFPLGRRIAFLRNQRGLTQAELAGKTGLSLSYIRGIERGEKLVGRASTLANLAEALELADVAELTGGYPFTVGPTSDASRLLHPTARQLGDLLRRPMLAAHVDASPPPTVEQMQDRCDELWEIWHNSKTFYSDTAIELPALLVDAHRLLRSAEGDKRPAWRVMAQAYHLARQWLRKVQEYELAIVAAERSLHASEQADDPLLIAMSAWNYVGLHNAGGRPEAGADVAAEAIRMLDEVPGSTQDRNLHGMRGALHLYAAIASARMDDADGAWRHWQAGDDIARDLGPTFFDQWTTFGAMNVAMYRVGINIDLGKGRDTTDEAERIDYTRMLCVERRTRHLIDVARGYGRREDDTAAVATLLEAEQQSPEEVAYSYYSRELLRHLMQRGRAINREGMYGLAARINVHA